MTEKVSKKTVKTTNTTPKSAAKKDASVKQIKKIPQVKVVQKKKIVFLGSEAAPFIATGGLADVIGALPKALIENGCDSRVIMPYYKKIKELNNA